MSQDSEQVETPAIPVTDTPSEETETSTETPAEAPTETPAE